MAKTARTKAQTKGPITETETIIPTGTEVPPGIDLDNDYALVIRNENEVQILCPAVPEGRPLTDGHILMLGLVQLLRQPGWASSLIEQMAKLLMESQKAANTPPSAEG